MVQAVHILQSQTLSVNYFTASKYEKEKKIMHANQLPVISIITFTLKQFFFLSEFEIIIFNKEEQEEENMATSKEFRVVGKDMVDYICDYVDTIEQRPPLAQVEPGYLQKLIPHEAPQKAESWEEIKKDIERVIMPGVSLA